MRLRLVVGVTMLMMALTAAVVQAAPSSLRFTVGNGAVTCSMTAASVSCQSATSSRTVPATVTPNSAVQTCSQPQGSSPGCLWPGAVYKKLLIGLSAPTVGAFACIPLGSFFFSPTGVVCSASHTRRLHWRTCRGVAGLGRRADVGITGRRRPSAGHSRQVRNCDSRSEITQRRPRANRSWPALDVYGHAVRGRWRIGPARPAGRRALGLTPLSLRSSTSAEAGLLLTRNSNAESTTARGFGSPRASTCATPGGASSLTVGMRRLVLDHRGSRDRLHKDPVKSQ